MNEPIITKYPKVITYIVLGIIAVLLISNVVQFFINRSIQKKFDIQSVELMVKNDSVKQYKTKAGEAYYKFQSVMIEKNALKGSLIADSIKIQDLTAMNVNYRDIISVLKFKLQVAGKISTSVHDSIVHDTIPGKPLLTIQTLKEWTDGHMTLNGSIYNKIFTGGYFYQANLLMVPERVGKSIVVTAKIDQENAKIITGSQITIAPQTYIYHRWYVYLATFLAGTAGGIYLSK